MRTVVLKVTVGVNHVLVGFQHPLAPPGINNNGAYTVHVINVPNDIPSGDVVHLFRRTGVYFTQKSKFVVDFAKLEIGKVVIIDN